MAAAKQVVTDYGGAFPDNYQELLKLKGVGNYTAAAIASFAFKEAVAVVDGNVFRVLSRMFGVEEDIGSPKGKKAFEALANELIPTDRPDLHNQAIMEFGALHCTPKKPNCMFCPFSQECEARKTGRQEQLPVKLKKTKVRDRYFHYLVIQVGTAVFLKLRQEKGIWQGLYDFPLIEGDNLAEWEALSEHGLISELGALTGITVEKSSETFRHILSHQRIFAVFFYLKVNENQEKVKEWGNQHGWQLFDATEIAALPKPVLLLKCIEQEGWLPSIG